MNNKKYENDGGYLVPAIISIPINKWQSFKQRFFPYWLQKIFPVKMDDIDVREALLKHSAEEEMPG